MTVHIAREDRLVLEVSGEPDKEACCRLVRAVLSSRGLPPWPGAVLTLFTAKGRSLLFARPGDGVTVSLAPWAVEWLLPS